MSRKKMSQREAASWKRRALYAEHLLNIRAFTPGNTRVIATFTCTEQQMREVSAAEQFGAKLRVEKTGLRFDVTVYHDSEAPINDA